MTSKVKGANTPLATSHPEPEGGLICGSIIPVTHHGDGDSTSPEPWTPFLSQQCSFGPEIFSRTMLNFIQNPNLNTTWLFRADILYDDGGLSSAAEGRLDQSGPSNGVRPWVVDFEGFHRQRTIVRRLIPRNTRRDDPLDQTCLICNNLTPGTDATEDVGHQCIRTAVVYIPHEKEQGKLPFYHPKVRAVAHIHQWDPATETGILSVHFSLFPLAATACLESKEHRDGRTRLQRTALQLLTVLHKHGEGQAAGYVKRVQHDAVIPQMRSQNRYSRLKLQYAQQLMEMWIETTDPAKHVFEDLGIAAFLIELWADMYGGDPVSFPGFVDIGCGNGLLVYILRMEGYRGWGFDARERRSWANYEVPGATAESKTLKQLVLLPRLASTESGSASNTHDGVFPRGTFIISNHADELTPWTPILAAASECPFISIPCCSHNLTGDRWRAPPPRGDRQLQSRSTYASLVGWVTQIAEDCGWKVETEMLRIPSTRNTCLLGRTRSQGWERANDVDYAAVISKHGGTEGYERNVLNLVKSTFKGH